MIGNLGPSGLKCTPSVEHRTEVYHLVHYQQTKGMGWGQGWLVLLLLPPVNGTRSPLDWTWWGGGGGADSGLTLTS